MLEEADVDVSNKPLRLELVLSCKICVCFIIIIIFFFWGGGWGLRFRVSGFRL